MLTRNMRKSSWQYFVVRGCNNDNNEHTNSNNLGEGSVLGFGAVLGWGLQARKGHARSTELAEMVERGNYD